MCVCVCFPTSFFACFHVAMAAMKTFCAFLLTNNKKRPHNGLIIICWQSVLFILLK